MAMATSVRPIIERRSGRNRFSSFVAVLLERSQRRADVHQNQDVGWGPQLKDPAASTKIPENAPAQIEEEINGDESAVGPILLQKDSLAVDHIRRRFLLA